MTAPQHIAISIGIFDRLPFAPECERAEIRKRSDLHAILARRHDLDGVLSSIVRHPAAPEFLRNLRG